MPLLSSYVPFATRVCCCANADKFKTIVGGYSPLSVTKRSSTRSVVMEKMEQTLTHCSSSYDLRRSLCRTSWQVKEGDTVNTNNLMPAKVVFTAFSSFSASFHNIKVICDPTRKAVHADPRAVGEGRTPANFPQLAVIRHSLASPLPIVGFMLDYICLRHTYCPQHFIIKHLHNLFLFRFIRRVRTISKSDC